MGKNIVICSDGTGNTAIKGRGTNVFKLFEAIDLNGHRTNPHLDPQVALYDDGVGTGSFVPLKVAGGAFGFGLARNVRKLYKELVRVYDPGDRIYVFGFSRGAFTVRTLAGMIAKCGVLDLERLTTSGQLQSAVSEAYRVYRRSYRTWIQRLFHTILHKAGLRKSDPDVLAAFREARSLKCDVRIRFIGVWDTVDAVGGPFHTSDIINALFHRFKFPDQKLSDRVDCARQALAIDEARAAFQPRLWESDPRIQQVWFSGVHSNVGGGYPKQGMSLVTLDWMLRAAGDNGLRILERDAQYYSEHGNADDKLYDSRAGLGIFYRWKPRGMWDVCESQKAGLPPAIHLSVIERIAHGTDGYNPGTLAGEASVAFTRSRNPDRAVAATEDESAALRSNLAELALRQAFAETGASLNVAGHTLWLGSIAYYLYVVSCLAVLFLASVPEDNPALTPWALLKSVSVLAFDMITGQWAPVLKSAVRLVTTPWMIGGLLAAFGLSFLLTTYADRVRSKTFSRFWHIPRQKLREALKESRKQLQGAPKTAGSASAT